MFALIIAIVSIALIVATVAATMYHGGDTLTQGRDKADAAAVIAGAQQVSGAAVMFASLEGTAAQSVAALVTGKYLASAPAVSGNSFALVPASKTVTLAVKSDGACAAINKSAGATAAKQTALLDADLATLPYGCVNGAAGSGGAFSFKF